MQRQCPTCCLYCQWHLRLPQPPPLPLWKGLQQQPPPLQAEHPRPVEGLVQWRWHPLALLLPLALPLPLAWGQ